MAAGVPKWQFSEDEIRAKLQELGYTNLPDKALREFSNDLHQLIATENAKRDLDATDLDSSTASTLNTSTSTISSTELSHDDEPQYARTQRYGVTFEQNAPYQNVGQTYPSRYRTQPNGGHSFVESHINKHEYIAPEKENQTERNLDASLRLAQKRKVLRRKDGKARVFDESFTNEVSATDISDVEERLQSLPLKDKVDNVSIHSDQSEGSSVWQQLGRNRNALPSFIRPKSCGPSTRGIRKTDPVNRYHEFKQEWRAKKVPGEKTHKNLRWSTREQMLQYETFEKPRHRYIPNSYVAPTDKKRQALRWEVRSTLANT